MTQNVEPTAGEWEAILSPGGQFEICTNRNGRHLVLASRMEHSEFADEFHANGVLMAAAKDMQKALVMAKESFESIGWKDTVVLETVIAALAKSKVKP